MGRIIYHFKDVCQYIFILTKKMTQIIM